MSIQLDHQFREQVSHTDADFPISFFHDELAQLPNRSGPLHWHPEFEIATSQDAILAFQVGQSHVILQPGDSIFINANVPHSIRQLEGSAPDPMPNIVFDAALAAAGNSIVNRQYIQPIKTCDSLPYVHFRTGEKSCAGIHAAIREIYAELSGRGPCYEMRVQRSLNSIFEYLALHFESLPRVETSRIQMSTQIRIQQMLSYLYDHYAEDIRLRDIAQAASISRSEAGRCFQAYMGCSPVEALIQYRLQTAHAMLRDSEKTLLEICLACGFHSVNYFSRQFRRYYGCAPSAARTPGK